MYKLELYFKGTFVRRWETGNTLKRVLRFAQKQLNPNEIDCVAIYKDGVWIKEYCL